MATMSRPLAFIGAIVALLVIVAVPVYAEDCPQPGDMISVTIDVKPGSYPNPINLKTETTKQGEIDL